MEDEKKPEEEVVNFQKWIDAGYVAGMIDSASSISLTVFEHLKKRGEPWTEYIPRIVMIRPQDSFLKRLHQHFGGSLSKTNEGRTRWTVTHARAIRFLKVYSPYLKIKGKAVAILVKIADCQTAEEKKLVSMEWAKLKEGDE